MAQKLTSEYGIRHIVSCIEICDFINRLYSMLNIDDKIYIHICVSTRKRDEEKSAGIEHYGDAAE